MQIRGSEPARQYSAKLGNKRLNKLRMGRWGKAGTAFNEDRTESTHNPTRTMGRQACDCDRPQRIISMKRTICHAITLEGRHAAHAEVAGAARPCGAARRAKHIGGVPLLMNCSVRTWRSRRKLHS